MDDRFPGFDVLSQAPHWDQVTADLIASRSGRSQKPSATGFFTTAERACARARAAQAVVEDILRAAGADEVITIQRYAHLVGGARMAADERHGVVDRHCRSFAVPNLYITDGSVLPTQGSANPALTIMAVAARAADQLISGSRAG